MPIVFDVYIVSLILIDWWRSGSQTKACRDISIKIRDISI